MKLSKLGLKFWWARKGWKVAILLMFIILLWGVNYFWGREMYKELSQGDQVAFAQYQKPTYEMLPDTVKDTLKFYAELYAVDMSLVNKIVNCESKFNSTITGDSQAALTSRGLWQFSPLTFFTYAKKYGVKNADINDYRDQTIVAIQMLRDGKRTEWTCGK